MFSVYLAYWMGERAEFFCPLACDCIPCNFSNLNLLGVGEGECMRLGDTIRYCS